MIYFVNKYSRKSRNKVKQGTPLLPGGPGHGIFFMFDQIFLEYKTFSIYGFFMKYDPFFMIFQNMQ